jgi:hypothetical protein
MKVMRDDETFELLNGMHDWELSKLGDGVLKQFPG